MVPFIPDTAPFTPAQRAWLNGFLAGIFSAAQPAVSAPAAVKVSVSVLFGSESGNCESLAKRVAKAAQKRGFESKAMGLDKISAGDLAREKYALIITSTFGEGDPPENAMAFHAELHATTLPRLENLSYAVLALGERNYEQFCKCGIDFDVRLAALGATRVYERVECDVDYEADFARWESGVFGVLEALAQNAGSAPAGAPAHANLTSPMSGPVGPPPPGTAGAPAMKGDGPVEAGHLRGPTSPGMTGASPHAGSASAVMTEAPPLAAPTYSRKHPFPGRLLVNRKLTGDTSAKETRHFEISLEGSDLSYEAGDALGVVPTNCPTLVDELLHVLNRDGEEAVPAPDGGEIPLRAALLRHYEITKVPALLLKAIAERSSDRTLADLMKTEAKDALAHYLWAARSSTCSPISHR